MAYAIFPQRLLIFSEAWRIANPVVGGGTAFNGQEQFIVSPASRWEAKISFRCVEDDDYLDAEGFLAGLDGPATPFILPIVDWRGRPWNTDPLSGGLITPAAAKLASRTDPAFEANPDTTSQISFTLDQPALMNSTTLVIRRNKGGALKRGQKFSIDNRVHIIVAPVENDPVDPNTGLAVPGTVTVKIRPWLRQNYAGGTPVEFSNPAGLMALSKETQAIVERTTSPISEIPLGLVEYIS